MEFTVGEVAGVCCAEDAVDTRDDPCESFEVKIGLWGLNSGHEAVMWWSWSSLESALLPASNGEKLGEVGDTMLSVSSRLEKVKLSVVILYSSFNLDPGNPLCGGKSMEGNVGAW